MSMTIPLNQWKVRNAHRNSNPDEMQNWHCHPNCNNKPIQSQIQGSLNPRKDRIIEYWKQYYLSTIPITCLQYLFRPFLPSPTSTTKTHHKKLYLPSDLESFPEILVKLMYIHSHQPSQPHPKNTSRPQASAATISSKFGVSTTCEGQWC